MFNSWFGSKSSTSRNTYVTSKAGDTLTVPKDSHSSPSDASSVSQSTVGPSITTDIPLSQSDIPLDEVHASINDTSVYAPTPSLIQSTEKNDVEVVTLRTSLPSLELPKTQGAHGNAQILKRDETSPGVHLEETLFTPQDAIIEEVFGKPGAFNAVASVSVSDQVPSSSAMLSQEPRPSISLMTSDSSNPLPSTPTPTHTHATKSYIGPTVTVFEPFSGAKLSEHAQVLPGNGTSETAAAAEQPFPISFPSADDRTLWSSLEKILELQAEVAAMHADMEGVSTRGLGSNASGIGRGEAGSGFSVAGGPGEAGKAGVSRKKSRRGQTLPIGDEEEPGTEAGAAGEGVTDTDTDHTEEEPEDADDDEDEDDIHGYGKRRRDEEFAMIADQFAHRKAVIGGIMNKLDDLSMALKTFHALPTPMLDLGMSTSRANTVSSAASSPPPFSAYPRRPSSPMSSISQAGASFTSPSVPIPPIPPPSTLVQVAPSIPSRNSDTPPEIVPVLPPTALPTILPGFQHVESPADMLSDQSIFRRRPTG